MKYYIGDNRRKRIVDIYKSNTKPNFAVIKPLYCKTLGLKAVQHMPEKTNNGVKGKEYYLARGYK